MKHTMDDKTGFDDEQVQCPRCQGSGLINQAHGDRSPERECPYCHGETTVTEDQYHAYFDMRKG
jgi:DnaJ-class molecular chaperone